ncbi:unnamed protein product, partial [marine sediment metagenome]
MTILRDANTGDAMHVDTEHYAYHKAICSPYEAHTNIIHEDVYTMDLDSIVVDGDGYYIVSLQNTSDKNLIVTSITLWTNQNKDDCNVEVYLGGTLASAGTTAVTPSNCASGSGHAAEGTFYVNDGAGNMTVTTAGNICGRRKFSTTPHKWVKNSGWRM